MKRDRQTLTQIEKHRSFRRAFEVINTHRDHQDFLAAYVIAFGVFEDRITAAMMLALDLAGRPRPTNHVPLYQRIKTLLDLKHIDLRTARDWRHAGDERNELIHAAMWHVDLFSSEHVEVAYNRARTTDALARRLRRLVTKQGAGPVDTVWGVSERSRPTAGG